jgi:uncharacterized protein YecT (DUF1311 family)
MALRIIISVLFLAVISGELNAQSADDCDYKNADSVLNAVYRQILSDYKADTLFIKMVKQAQRSWVSFRDAHIASRFPLANDGKNGAYQYGSVSNICACQEMADLTRQRITQLQKWLDGEPEGNVCTGSYRLK